LVQEALSALKTNAREGWNAARITIAQVLDSRTVEWTVTSDHSQHCDNGSRKRHLGIF